MADTLPALKTGAPAQYPSSKSVSYSSYVVKFLDGSDQRYRNYSVPLTQWSFPLAMLDDSEMTLLGQFFAGQQGQYGSFSLYDPWTQTEHASCSFSQDTITNTLKEEAAGSTEIAIRENKS